MIKLNETKKCNFKSLIKEESAVIYYPPISGNFVPIRKEKISEELRSHEKYPKFDDWCSCVSTLKDICFQQELNDYEKESLRRFLKLESCWESIYAAFIDAIKSHKRLENNIDISSKSAKYFLYLIPIFASHDPHVYVDSSSGCFNVDIPIKNNGILGVQISENGQVYFSRVARNRAIVKITGSAKIKDPRDFIEISRILKML